MRSANSTEIESFSENLRSEVQDATQKLRTTNRKLKKLDRAKDEFVSMASHQLRTPLTAAKNYTALMQAGKLGAMTPRQMTATDHVYHSINRMVGMIDELLDVSRITAGKFEIHLEEVNLGELIKREVRQIEPLAQERKVRLEFRMPDEPILIKADATKMTEAIMNFIDNAVQYTRERTSVRVTLKVNGSLAFTVEDHGSGVPKEEQAQLFKKFFRAANARKTRPDGTGLGLFVAKRVIEEHGGSIIFKSVEGRGSTFGFRLPKHLLLE